MSAGSFVHRRAREGRREAGAPGLGLGLGLGSELDSRTCRIGVLSNDRLSRRYPGYRTW